MKPYKKITLLYLIIGAAWIFFSDRFFSSLFPAAFYIGYIQTYKGWFFILATSSLLYFLIRRMYYRIQEREEDKRKIFIATMSAVHHILNNFLHKMMYLKYLRAENDQLSAEAQKQYDDVIMATSQQIIKLGEISNISPEEIEKTVFPEKFSSPMERKPTLPGSSN
jgi:hypothetical protein